MAFCRSQFGIYVLPHLVTSPIAIYKVETIYHFFTFSPPSSTQAFSLRSKLKMVSFIISVGKELHVFRIHLCSSETVDGSFSFTSCCTIDHMFSMGERSGEFGGQFFSRLIFRLFR